MDANITYFHKLVQNTEQRFEEEQLYKIFDGNILLWCGTESRTPMKKYTMLC
jgi:hypothetical protein